mmetsp:Transcript_27531/g.107848  ORF Transcript_27531/g.107848 Transcript_27531/m.107848 type:complete len:263 (+) Transcript_27531:251-1039(+)
MKICVRSIPFHGHNVEVPAEIPSVYSRQWKAVPKTCDWIATNSPMPRFLLNFHQLLRWYFRRCEQVCPHVFHLGPRNAPTFIRYFQSHVLVPVRNYNFNRRYVDVVPVSFHCRPYRILQKLEETEKYMAFNIRKLKGCFPMQLYFGTVSIGTVSNGVNGLSSVPHNYLRFTYRVDYADIAFPAVTHVCLVAYQSSDADSGPVKPVEKIVDLQVVCSPSGFAFQFHDTLGHQLVNVVVTRSYSNQQIREQLFLFLILRPLPLH